LLLDKKDRARGLELHLHVAVVVDHLGRGAAVVGGQLPGRAASSAAGENHGWLADGQERRGAVLLTRECQHRTTPEKALK
jgi:hypothetical protein